MGTGFKGISTWEAAKRRATPPKVSIRSRKAKGFVLTDERLSIILLL